MISSWAGKFHLCLPSNEGVFFGGEGGMLSKAKILCEMVLLCVPRDSGVEAE